MLAFPQRVRHGLITVWTVAVLVFVFLPGVTILLASLTASRYFTFPIPKWGLEWWDKTFSSFEVRQLLATSLSIAARGHGHCRGDRLLRCARLCPL